MKKIFCLCVLSLLSTVFSPAQADDAAQVPEQIESGIFEKAAKKFGVTGTFIQIWSDHLYRTADQWQSALKALHSLGNQTFVIQYSKFNKDSMIPQKEGQIDAMEQIFAYADQNGIDVYMGTVFDSRWITEYNNPKTLSELAVQNEDFIPILWNRYGHHKSFAGWYIPFETMDWDFADLSIFFTDVFNQRFFFQRLVNACRSNSDRPVKVMAGAYFVGRMPPSYVEYSYTELLKNTGLDIFLVQDGFGVRHWASMKDPRKMVQPYYEAFKNAAEANHMQLWSIAESFEMVETVDHFEKGGLSTKMGLDFLPTNLTRMKTQVELTKPYADKIIQFDGFHYSNPIDGFHNFIPETGNSSRVQLYKDIRTQILAE